MITLSATCIAIAVAAKSGTLRVERRNGRLGEYVAISDDCGLIEVANSEDEARERVRAVTSRI